MIARHRAGVRASLGNPIKDTWFDIFYISFKWFIDFGFVFNKLWGNVILYVFKILNFPALMNSIKRVKFYFLIIIVLPSNIGLGCYIEWRRKRENPTMGVIPMWEIM